jgi:hypothetical protein
LKRSTIELIGEQKIIEFRPWYERKISINPFQVIFPFDIFYSYVTVSQMGRILIIDDEANLNNDKSFFNYTINEAGISPTIGLNYRAGNRISYSIETNWDFSYFELESEQNKKSIVPLIIL